MFLSSIILSLTYYITQNKEYLISNNTLITQENILFLVRIFRKFLSGHNYDPISPTTPSTTTDDSNTNIDNIDRSDSSTNTATSTAASITSTATSITSTTTSKSGHNSDPSSTVGAGGSGSGGIDIRICESLLKLIINISVLLRNSPHTMILYELFLSYKDDCSSDNNNGNTSPTATNTTDNNTTVTNNNDSNNVPLIIYLSQIGRNPLFR